MSNKRLYWEEVVLGTKEYTTVYFCPEYNREFKMYERGMWDSNYFYDIRDGHGFSFSDGYIKEVAKFKKNVIGGKVYG